MTASLARLRQAARRYRWLALVIPAYAQDEKATPALGNAFKNFRTLTARVGFGDQPPRPEELVARLIFVALGMVGVVFVSLIIYGGYLWMTARGNEEQVNKAQRIITESVIGVVVVFLAYFITAFVVQRVGETVFEPLRFF
jgi:TRAP-type C4-dicarboxylate transport system permease small subunit